LPDSVLGNAQFDPVEFVRRLRTSLSQAFPVGFFGLIWTFVGHFFAFRRERVLRAEVRDALGRAVAADVALTKGPWEKLDEALAPIRDLRNVLSTSLKDVIEGFRDHLERTSDLVLKQIQPLTSAVSNFQGSVDNLVQATQT